MYSDEDDFQNTDLVCGVGYVRGQSNLSFSLSVGHGCERLVTGVYCFHVGASLPRRSRCMRYAAVCATATRLELKGAVP